MQRIAAIPSAASSFQGSAPARTAKSGLPGLVYVGNGATLARAGAGPSKKAPGSSRFGEFGQLIGIRNKGTHVKESPIPVAFHGTGMNSAIGLIRSGLQEPETRQHTNLAAGGFCIGLKSDTASSYARDRLGQPLGSLAAVLAVVPRSGNVNLREECASGGLEPIEAPGHDSEFIVSETCYGDFSLQWHSLLCRVPSGVAEFRVNNAQVSDPLDQEGCKGPTLLLSVTEQNVEDRNRSSGTGVYIDMRTGQAVRWE